MKLLGRNDQADRVDAVRGILHRKAVGLKDFKHLAHRAHLGGQSLFADADHGEILLAGDAGDEVPVRVGVVVEALHDNGAGVGGIVGIADIERDVLFCHREDRVLMQDLRTEIAELAELGIGHAGDRFGVFHDPGVRHQNAGDVGPVLIDLRVQSRSSQSAGDIGASAGEGADVAVRSETVEAGNYDFSPLRKPLQRSIGKLLIDGAVHAEPQPFGGVHKIEAQIIGHQPGGEILAARGQSVLGNIVLQAVPDPRKLRFQIGRKAQIVPDLQIAGADHREYGVAGDPVAHMGMAEVEQIGDFVVLRHPLAGGGDDDDGTRRVCLHDGLDLCILRGARHGAAAKFQNLTHVGDSFIRKCPERRRGRRSGTIPAALSYVTRFAPVRQKQFRARREKHQTFHCIIPFRE